MELHVAGTRHNVLVTIIINSGRNKNNVIFKTVARASLALTGPGPGLG